LQAREIHVRRQRNARVRAYTDPKYGPYSAALVDDARRVIGTRPRDHDAPRAFLTLRGHHYTPSTRSHHWNRDAYARRGNVVPLPKRRAPGESR